MPPGVRTRWRSSQCWSSVRLIPNRAPGERSRFADAARRGRESVIWLAAVQDATDMGDYEALERLVELEQRRSDL